MKMMSNLLQVYVAVLVTRLDLPVLIHARFRDLLVWGVVRSGVVIGGVEFLLSVGAESVLFRLLCVLLFGGGDGGVVWFV